MNQPIICHNPGTWHDSSLESLAIEESYHWTNCKTKYKLESQNSLGNNHASFTWEHLWIICKQLYQCDLGTIVPVTLGNNRFSLTWKNRASLTWEQLCQSNFGTIVPVSLGNNCVSLTWEQSCQSHLGTMEPVSLGKNCTSLTWK